MDRLHNRHDFLKSRNSTIHSNSDKEHPKIGKNAKFGSAPVEQRPQQVVPNISQLRTRVIPTLDYRLSSLAWLNAYDYRTGQSQFII